MGQFDPTRLKAELEWLKNHPQFEQRPATIREFVGPDYLNIQDLVRPAVMAELEAIVGTKVRGDRITKYPRAMFTGGIGIGKTTIASIVLSYMAHWVLCLKDPQKFFDLLPGSRIAFMQMSTSGRQAEDVIFEDVKGRIDHSPWFLNNYSYDPKWKKQLRFPKGIWIVPGDSEETTFEGYNILGGILDEADSHKITETKDYAQEGYNTISNRITSRFQDRGFLIVIGQMKRANGFAARKYAEFKKDPDAYTVRMAIWESFGWEKFLNSDGTRNSFWYDTVRHEIIPSGAAEMLAQGNPDRLVEVPNTYLIDFKQGPEKALRDLAGIPPATGSPFISLSYKITECRERWLERYNPRCDPEERVIRAPVKANRGGYLPQFESWFIAPDKLKRVIHLDMAYSSEGDALGLAMGHVPEVIEIEDEWKPVIVFDCLIRIHAPAGREIFISDVRRVIYDLRDQYGFRIVKATMDGFQSTDTRQQLAKKRILTEIVSVDKNLLPYEDLREALYDDRIEFPEYMVRLREDDVELTEIAVKELMELVDAGKKVDHPEGGSKDVADTMAGVVYTLTGDRSYHGRKKREARDRILTQPEPPARSQTGRVLGQHPALVGTDGLRAPMPPIGESVWIPPTRR